LRRGFLKQQRAILTEKTSTFEKLGLFESSLPSTVQFRKTNEFRHSKERISHRETARSLVWLTLAEQIRPFVLANAKDLREIDDGLLGRSARSLGWGRRWRRRSQIELAQSLMPAVLDIVPTSATQEFSDFDPFWANLMEFLDNDRILFGSPGIGDERVQQVILVSVSALAGRPLREKPRNLFPTFSPQIFNHGAQFDVLLRREFAPGGARFRRVLGGCGVSDHRQSVNRMFSDLKIEFWTILKRK
jgi:hypothetical protein